MDQKEVILSIEIIGDLSKRITREEVKTYYIEKYEKTCWKQHGFIIKILECKEIIKQKISIYNGHIIITSKLLIQYLLPQIGNILSGIVLNQYPQGSILVVSDCMRAFIPYKTFKKGEIISFKIDQVRFKKGLWDCIGSMF